MDTVIQIDHELFKLINQAWTNDLFDTILPIFREKKTWIPLYISLAIFLFFKVNWKKSILILSLAITSIGVSDTLSSKVIKPNVERSRPCHDNSEIKENRLLIDCGGGYSFTSSHATNHFSLAIFLGFIFIPFFKFPRLAFISWAAIISYAQVYVGVHFPLDVICGALIGSSIGYGFYRLYMFLDEKYFTVAVSYT